MYTHITGKINNIDFNTVMNCFSNSKELYNDTSLSDDTKIDKFFARGIPVKLKRSISKKILDKFLRVYKNLVYSDDNWLVSYVTKFDNLGLFKNIITYSGFSNVNMFYLILLNINDEKIYILSYNDSKFAEYINDTNEDIFDITIKEFAFRYKDDFGDYDDLGSFLKNFLPKDNPYFWELSQPSYIQNKKIIDKVLKNNPLEIRHIDCLKWDTKICLKLLNRYLGKHFFKIRNLYDEKVMLPLILNDYKIMTFIPNIPEHWFTQIIRKYPHSDCFKWVNNPSSFIEEYAVSKDSYNIQYIDNPTEEIQLNAVKKEPFCLKYIWKPTYRVCKEAVKREYSVISQILEPLVELQMIAVRASELGIRFIDKPCYKAKQLHKKLWEK